MIMTPERYSELQHPDASLTEEEISEGWHFCCEYDFALIRLHECQLCGKSTRESKRDRVYSLFGFSVYKSPAGEISENPAWCCSYGCWFHCCGTLRELFWNVITVKSDRHLIG